MTVKLGWTVGLAWMLGAGAVFADHASKEVSVRLVHTSGKGNGFGFDILHSFDRRNGKGDLVVGNAQTTIDRMDIRLAVQWNVLLKEARRVYDSLPVQHVDPASGYVFKTTAALSSEAYTDRYGGNWIVVIHALGDVRTDFLRGFGYALIPDFPGYQVVLGEGGRIVSARAVHNWDEWTALRRQEEEASKSDLQKMMERIEKRIQHLFE